MFKEALSYPTEHDDWLITVLIGGVLTFLGFLILPLLLVYGYVVRVIQTTTAGEARPPVFEDWGPLLVDGAKAAIIGIVYTLIPLVLIGILVAVVAVLDLPTALFVLIVLLSFPLVLAFTYLATVGIVIFAREDSIGAAFDLARVREIALSRSYVVPWLLAVVVAMLVGIVGVIPFIGQLLAPFAVFYAFVVAGRLWATGAIDATA